ncbi:MAG TPA: head GIN domain-containing protein [Prolixibacteraceae bacterium]|nr:head GIN domain-containing protein [Prolixibacteraceae bacterium]
MARIGSLIVLLGALLASLLTSCDPGFKQSNDFPEKKIQTEAFNRIILQGGYNVTLSQSEKSSLTIQASTANKNKLDIDVKDSTLYVKMRNPNISVKDTKLNISISDLKSLKLEGGLNLVTNGFLDLKKVFIDIAGGANAKFQLTANEIRAETEGGVNLEFEGITNDFTIKTEGAGNIDADRLEAQNVTCKIAGVGNASVYPTETLNAQLEGIGKISYRGNPVVTKQIEGIGLIYRK